MAIAASNNRRAQGCVMQEAMRQTMREGDLSQPQEEDS